MPTHTRVAQLVEHGEASGPSSPPRGRNGLTAASPPSHTPPDCKRTAGGVDGHDEASGSAVRSSPRVPLPVAPPHWEESHAPRKWAVGWHEPLLCATGPYLYRWYVETPWGSLRLHHWLHGDDHRGWHSHPWAFWTRLLRGEYTDLSPEGEVTLRAGDRAYRPAHYAHTVRLDNGPCWSLVVTGPLVRRWGFFDGKRWWRSNKWLAEREKFACQ